MITLQETIKSLQALGLPPLPIAPRISDEFNGKNPSYIDRNGHHRHIAHSKYRVMVPSSADIETWFANKNVGIGTLGIRDIVWIDIDRKHFDSQEDCDDCFNGLLSRYEALKNAWLEKTQSSGYRIGLKVKNIPDFYNWKLEDKQLGELLHSGRFTVLSPTLGVTGNRYVNLNRPKELPIIDSIESLGIIPTRVNRKIELSQQPKPLTFTNSDKQLSLIDCISKRNRAILESSNFHDNDKSLEFSTALKDLYGWEKWLLDDSISFAGNADSIAYESGRNKGYDDKKIKRIIESVGSNCHPALHYVGGNDACVSKVQNLLGIKKLNSECLDAQNWANWVNSRKFFGSNKQESNHFKFPENTPKNNAIICVKSGLGTGKTDALLSEIASKNEGSIILGYRNNLLFQTIARGNEKGIKILHINEDDMIEDIPGISLAGCINSGYKLSGMFKGKDIYFDEIESVISHLIDGGTFSNQDQKRAMNIFEEAIRESNRVFLLDGNLKQETVNFIKQFSSNKELFLVENSKKINPHNIYFVEGVVHDAETQEIVIKPKAKSHLIEHLSDKETRPFIMTDSKKFAHELQEYLIRNNKIGICISADTIHEPYAKQFLEDPDRYIREVRPDFVIVTPSCESGVSITAQHFTAKYSFFCGVLSTSSQHQMMFRLRDNTINHYVYCPEYSQLRDNSLPTTYTEKSIRDALLDRINLSAMLCIDNASFHEAKDIIISALERMTNDKWFDYSCKLWALSNFEKSNLRRCLVSSLEDAGHSVEHLQWEVNKGLDGYMAEIKEELIDQEAKLLFEATPFNSMEECKEHDKKDNDIKTRRRINKTKLLLETLPGIDKEDCYGVDLFKKRLKTRNYISAHQNFSRLNNFEYLLRKHEEDLFYKTTSERTYIANLRFTNYSKLAILHELKIMDLLTDRNKEFTKESATLVNLFNEINNDNRKLKLLGIGKYKETEDKKEILILFKQLLAMIGLELAKPRKAINESGKRINHYKIDWEKYDDPLRQAIVRITTQKDNCWLETHQEIPWIQENTTNVLAKNLKESINKSLESGDYSYYQNALNLIEQDRFNGNVKTEEQIKNNEKLDRIISNSLSNLTDKQKQQLKDMKPAPRNFMDVIDQSIVAKNPSVEELLQYFKKQNSLKLWNWRLKEAIQLGKQFFLALNCSFFNDCPIPDNEDKDYIRLFEHFELMEKHYCG